MPVSESRSAVAIVAVLATTFMGVLLLVPLGASAQEGPDGLGTAFSYSVLGGETVTNTGTTTVWGDVGVSPGTAITGPPIGGGGARHAGDAEAAQAQVDLDTAYDTAAGRAPTATVAGDLVGLTLTPGVYFAPEALLVTGTLQLDGQGDPDSVFIFQLADSLTTGSASIIELIGDAQACNVFWQVGSSATLGTGSSFKGTIMALASITVTTGTVVEGRALAREGQVSLDNNVFTMPGCATGPTPTSPTSTPTSLDSGSSTTSSVPVATPSTAPPTSGAVTPPGSPGLDRSSGPTTPRSTPPSIATTGTASQTIIRLGAALLLIGVGMLLADLTRRPPVRRLGPGR